VNLFLTLEVRTECTKPVLEPVPTGFLTIRFQLVETGLRLKRVQPVETGLRLKRVQPVVQTGC